MLAKKSLFLQKENGGGQEIYNTINQKSDVCRGFISCITFSFKTQKSKAKKEEVTQEKTPPNIQSFENEFQVKPVESKKPVWSGNKFEDMGDIEIEKPEGYDNIKDDIKPTKRNRSNTVYRLFSDMLAFHDFVQAVSCA